MLVFSGVMGTLCLLTGTATLFVPLPEGGPGAAAVRPILVGLYAIPLPIAVAWLVYFTRKTTVAAFAAETFLRREHPAARPAAPR